MNARRPFALALIIVLVAGGISLGVWATSSPAAPRVDHLILDGHPPRTIELAVSVSTGGSFSTSGTFWIDTATSALSATLEVPVLTADTSFSVRALGGRLYLTSPNLADASGPVWYSMKVTWPSITALARYLVRPNPSLLALLANTRVTHSGFTTTYVGSRQNLALNTFGSKSGAKLSGTLDVRLSTGQQGEFTGLWASLASPSATTTVDMRVLSYDRPVTIVAPSPSRSTTPAAPLINELLTSGALGSLVLPAALVSALDHAKVVK